ncbi:MAG: fatty acid desaturase [Armatimonas sp.]
MNRIVGYLTGVLTFTGFAAWQHAHSVHHGTAGDLDRRGAGDVWTMTVDEYKAAPRHTRFYYYLIRSPWFLIPIGAPFMFLVLNRFLHKKSGKRETRSIVLTNLTLLASAIVANYTIGLKTYLLVQIPIISIAAMIGVWLFYLQHQFEEVYWERHADWDPIRAALVGSSYLKLPPVLMWFTGNIGLHHIHHLRPRIPSYNLQRCYDDIPALQQAHPMSFRGKA